MQRASESLMRIIRPEARRVHSELEELRIQHTNLQGEFQRFRVQLARTSRVARRVDRAWRAMGMYGDAHDDDNLDLARNGASYWEWQP